MLAPADPRWNLMLRTAPHDFYLLPGYVALAARFDGGEPIAVLVEDGPRQLLMPLLLRDVPATRNGPPRLDATSPYGYPGMTVSSQDPAVPTDRAFTREAVGVAIGALREAGVISLFLRLNALLPVDYEVLGDVGRLVSHGHTVSIDLLRDEDDLFQNMRTDHRRNIARLDRLGFTYLIDPACSPESVAGFLKVYTETMDRLGATSSYYFDAAYLNDLHTALDGRTTLVLIRQGDEVAAAALFGEVDGIVQYHLGGTHESFIKFSPIKGIFSATASWAKSRGNRVLHLGGGLGGAEDALFNFKAGFSRERHLFQTARIIIDQAVYDAFNTDWAERNGGFVSPPVGFFPAYRAPPTPPLPPVPESIGS